MRSEEGAALEPSAARQVLSSLAGPGIAFLVLLAEILTPGSLDAVLWTGALFVAVVVGAAFGGRWSALATAALSAVGIVLSLGDRLGMGAAGAILMAIGVALLTGELRDRALRAEANADIANTRLRRLALRDPLTGLLDRRGFDLAMRVELAREARRGGHFALLLAELSEMESAVDRFGRSVGDTVLQVFGDALEQRIRKSDIAGRVSDAEFAVILPDTDANGAEVVAHAVRENFVGHLRGIVPAEFRVGERFAIARYPDDGDSTESLFVAAKRQWKSPE